MFVNTTYTMYVLYLYAIIYKYNRYIHYVCMIYTYLCIVRVILFNETSEWINRSHSKFVRETLYKWLYFLLE